MPTNAEVMAQALAARGVRFAFGLPGGEVIAFIDACRQAGIRFLLTGHESSAAWMAQVIGQISGVPGLCIATLGPGATNLVTGVANALLDRAPMLAVTADLPQASAPTLTHQRLNLQRLFAPVAKASWTAAAGDPIDLMNRALDLASAPRSGPVHVALPRDVAIAEHVSHPIAEQISLESSPGSAAIQQAAARLAAAERPLVLVGLGTSGAARSALLALIEKLQAPFIVTAKAKGILDEDHPFFLGVASGMAIDGEVVETIRAADLILAIGFDPVECDKTWFASSQVVALDDVSMSEGDYRPLEAVGDIEGSLASLTVEASPKSWPVELLDARRAALRREPIATNNGLSPLRAIQELRSVFPRDGIAACDVGSHKLVMGQFWKTYEPGTFLMSNGLSAMGFGIPAAIAAQLARPEKRVMAVVGDGGMLMMVHDLALIRELALPIVVVVFTDRSLSLIRVSAERRGFPPSGTDFTPPDFPRIAQAFGIAGQRATGIAAIRACVETALNKRIPMLIEIPIDYREYYELV